MVRGLRSMHGRKEEVIPIMMRWLNQSQDVAKDSYDSILPSFSVDGAAVDKTFEFAIEARRATVKSDKVPLAQVRGITLLREVQNELRLQ